MHGPIRIRQPYMLASIPFQTHKMLLSMLGISIMTEHGCTQQHTHPSCMLVLAASPSATHTIQHYEVVHMQNMSMRRTRPSTMLAHALFQPSHRYKDCQHGKSHMVQMPAQKACVLVTVMSRLAWTPKSIGNACREAAL